MSNPLSSGYAECAAFVWRHGSRVRLAGVTDAEVNATHEISNMHGCSAFGIWEGSQPDHRDSMGLKRGIYTGRFSVCSGKAQLHLCSVHIDQGGQKGSNGPTVENGSRLPRLIEAMQDSTAKEKKKKKKKKPFFAVLGDFNRDAGHSDFERMRSIRSKSDKTGCSLCLLLAPGVPTNLSGNAQYDNAWVPAEQRQAWSDACVLAPPAEIVAMSAPEAGSRYSDHRMVYMTFKV